MFFRLENKISNITKQKEELKENGKRFDYKCEKMKLDMCSQSLGLLA